jgi:hypothetical protein
MPQARDERSVYRAGCDVPNEGLHLAADLPQEIHLHRGEIRRRNNDSDSNSDSHGNSNGRNHTTVVVIVLTIVTVSAEEILRTTVSVIERVIETVIVTVTENS